MIRLTWYTSADGCLVVHPEYDNSPETCLYLSSAESKLLHTLMNDFAEHGSDTTWSQNRQILLNGFYRFYRAETPQTARSAATILTPASA